MAAPEFISVVEHERIVAEMRLTISQLTQRYDSANKDRNSRAEERANLVSQLYQYGLHTNALGKIVRSSSQVDERPVLITKEVETLMMPLSRPSSPWKAGAEVYRSKDGQIHDYTPGQNPKSSCSGCSNCECDNAGKGSQK